MKFRRLPFIIGIIITVGIMAAPKRAAAQSRPMGTDVSSYQGSGIDWPTMRTDGISFAWAKATEGTYFIDADFTINETNAKAAGVYMGAYHFARPSDDPNITGANSADTEAQYFWATAGKYVVAGGGYLVPMLDWEDPYVTNVPSLTETVMSQWVNEWCNQIVRNAASNGVAIKPVVYTGSWYSEPSGTYPGLNTTVTNWPSWIASYPSCTTTGGVTRCGSTTPQTSVPANTYPWSSWNLWQYGDTNWSGGDSDVFNGTTNQFLQLFLVGYAAAPAGATLDWDPAGKKASPGSGGTGSWDSNTTDWWLSGSSNLSWALGGNNPIFAGTAGTVTLNASLNASTLTFNTAGYTIAGTANTLTLTNKPAVITVPAPATSPVNINCIMAGSGYTVSGGGVLVLNNTLNSLTSPVSIASNTTLAVASSRAIGTGSGTVTINGGTLQNNDTNGGDAFLNSAFDIVLGTGGGNLNDKINASLTYGGIISGTGGLTKTGGGGALILTAANTYSGNTIISQGTLALGSAGSINNSSQIDILPGATFDVSAISSWTLETQLHASGIGNTVGNTAATINGASGGLINFGSLPLTLIFTPTATNGDVTHPSLYISQGTLVLSHGNTITISNASASPLGAGSYRLIQQASGSMSNNPYPTAFFSSGGAGVASNMTCTLATSGTSLYLTIAHTTATTLSPLTGSTYGQSVTFTATVSPTPSGGSVQFYDNAVALGSPVTLSGGTASYTTSALAAGSHPITAGYTGNSSYAGSTNSALTQQVTKAALNITASPQSKTYGTTLAFGSGSTNFTSSGLQNGNTIGSVTLAVSGNGGASSAPVGTYAITPSLATGGTFSAANYTIGYNTGTLTVTLPANTIPVNISAITPLGDGTVHLNFSGTPGYVYMIEAATNLIPPVTWSAISTNAADSNGNFNFTDTDATNYGCRFYRTAAQ